MIGTEGRGWDLIMGGFYGGNIGAAYMDAQQKLDKMVAWCKTARRNGKPLIDDAVVRDQLAEMDLLVQAERLLTYESLSNIQSRRPPAFAGAIGTVVSKESMTRFAELTNLIAGRAGQLALMVRYAAGLLDAGLPASPAAAGGQISKAVSEAKAQASMTARLAPERAHAVHAGIAFILDFDVQLFTRRCRHWELDIGDERYHRERIAAALAA
jgi:alkylation response protein AidB-like acyl-CoA dehydrogenase